MKRRILALALVLCLLPAVYLLSSGADNHLLFTLGAVLSLLPEAVLLVIVNAAFKRKGAPRAVSVPLLLSSGIFFGTMSVLTVLGFVRANRYFSSHFVGSALVIALTVLSSLYIASLSDGAVRRLCSAVLLLELVLYGLIVLMALKNGTYTNLHLSSRSPFDDVKKGLLAGAMIFEPDVYFLVTCLISYDERPLWGRFLWLKGCILLLFTVPVLFVVGEHSHFSRLPAYDLSAYSKSVLVERFNGLFMGLVTLAAVTKTALEMYALRRCAEKLVVGKEALNEKA